MNLAHLEKIFSNYINRFDELNNSEHQEYDKWQAVQSFHGLMDDALSADEADFLERLMAARNCSLNLIDSYTQPFYGLVQMAGREPETVRHMFSRLYEDDGGDPDMRQQRVSDFLNSSHALKERYFPNSFLYKNDMHSVTGYLFLYDPDRNYIFKATNARTFADCVDFHDDWGRGDDVNLAVYYRMCEQLVNAICRHKSLLEKDDSRFHNDWGVDGKTLYPDPKKHVLACDLLYDCQAYGLFDGISFSKLKARERDRLRARRERAQQLFDECRKTRALLHDFDRAAQSLNAIFCKGAEVRHQTFGEGVVTDNNSTDLVVAFPEVGEKTLKTCFAASHELILPANSEQAAQIKEDKPVLALSRRALADELEKLEKNLLPVMEYLD